MNSFVPTERTTLRRLPKRGEFDRLAVYQILDEGFICNVGFIVDGKPVVIPTSYWRAGDDLYIHGSAASRMLNSLEQGVDVCVAVTLIDGLVLARSAFHHSINYRSVVVFGHAAAVDDPDEKMKLMQAFTDHIIPGRWEDVRRPNGSELKATLVLKLPLVEASAKVRTGPPIDDAEDYQLSVWAGVVPLGIAAGSPISDDRLPADIKVPEYARRYARPAKVEAADSKKS